MTQTLDHVEQPDPGCTCSAWMRCARCYAAVEQDEAREQLDGWLARLGLQVTRPERKRPVLRLVR
jgi:hypothetical protein